METDPRPCGSFRAVPSPNVGSMVAMAANFRPSVICCDTSAKSRDKHLRPLALTVGQSSRGQQQEMDTSFTRSARRRDKGPQAATDGQNGKAGKGKRTHSNYIKRAKAQFGLHFGIEIPWPGENSWDNPSASPSLHFDFFGIKIITLLYEMVCLVLVLLAVFAQRCEEAKDMGGHHQTKLLGMYYEGSGVCALGAGGSICVSVLGFERY